MTILRKRLILLYQSLEIATFDQSINVKQRTRIKIPCFSVTKKFSVVLSNQKIAWLSRIAQQSRLLNIKFLLKRLNSKATVGEQKTLRKTNRSPKNKGTREIIGMSHVFRFKVNCLISDVATAAQLVSVKFFKRFINLLSLSEQKAKSRIYCFKYN